MSEKNVRLGKRKLICGIKNCRVRESRYISKSGDFQKTPNICDDCLEKAYGIMTAAESTPGGVVFGKVYSSTGSGKVVRMKKKKLLCAVKGCPSRESWYISAGGDFYGSPNICSDCLKKAYAECFQAADLSGFDIVCTPYESGSASVTTHPVKGSADGVWTFTNGAYYLNSYIFKAGDVVSVTVTASQTGTDNIVEVNDVSSSFESEATITVPKTVLTKPILISGALGTSFTVKVNYAEIAEAALSANTVEATPVVLKADESTDDEENVKVIKKAKTVKKNALE